MIEERSVHGKPTGGRKLAVLATVFLIVSIILVVYGFGQPADVAMGSKNGTSNMVNIFFFVGLFMGISSLVCWLLWLFNHPRKAK